MNFYYNNDPLKPIMNISLFLYKFVNCKLFLLLYDDFSGLYDAINISPMNNDSDSNSDIFDIITERIYHVSNYQIEFKTNSAINSQNEYYDDNTLTMIKLLELPYEYENLTSSDFNFYEIITDEKKIKRKLIWFTYDNVIKYILKYNKIKQKIKYNKLKNILIELINHNNLKKTLIEINKNWRFNI